MKSEKDCMVLFWGRVWKEDRKEEPRVQQTMSLYSEAKNAAHGKEILTTTRRITLDRADWGRTTKATAKEPSAAKKEEADDEASGALSKDRG